MIWVVYDRRFTKLEQSFREKLDNLITGQDNKSKNWKYAEQQNLTVNNHVLVRPAALIFLLRVVAWWKVHWFQTVGKWYGKWTYLSLSSYLFLLKIHIVTLIFYKPMAN